MIKLTLENLVREIVDLVPEFKEYEDFPLEDFNAADPAIQRGVLGVFGRYFSKLVAQSGESNPIVGRVYKFLNEQFNNEFGDEEILSWLWIEIFEVLVLYDESKEISRKLLHGKALESFNQTAAYFSPD